MSGRVEKQSRAAKTQKSKYINKIRKKNKMSNNELSFKNNGTYLFEIDSVKPVESKQKKTPGLEVSMRSIAGETKGKLMKDTIWRTKGTTWKINDFLNATGADSIPSDTISLYEAFNGKRIEVRMGIEEGREDEKTGVKYDDRNRVKKFVGPVTGSPSVVAEEPEAAQSTDVPF